MHESKEVYVECFEKPLEKENQNEESRPRYHRWRRMIEHRVGIRKRVERRLRRRGSSFRFGPAKKCDSHALDFDQAKQE